MAMKSLTGFDAAAQRGSNFADPSSPSDVATKAYVDNSLAGLRWKEPVRVATTTNGTLASAFANGSTIDGVTLATGDRILIKDQTDPKENGVYTVAVSGAPARSQDANTSAKLHGATVLVTSGTANADKSYTQTTDNPTLGTDGVVWAQTGAGNTYTADGQGLELTGTTFGLELVANGGLAKSGAGLSLAGGIDGGGLALNSGVLSVNAGSGLEIASDNLRISAGAAGNGLTGGAGAALAVGAAGGSGITVNTSDIAVDTSVVVRKYATSIGNGSNTTITVTHNLATLDVTVELFENSGGAQVFADVVHATTNTITVTFASAPSASAIRVVVHG